MTFRDTTSVFERLVDNSEETPGPLTTSCWVWQKGCCNKGYGFLYVYDPDAPCTGKGRQEFGKSVGIRAHIASWVLANGPVPADMTLDHLCVNTKCIRPSHLELVTRPENSRRQGQRRRLRRAELVEKAFPAPQEQAANGGPYDQHFNG